jgi:transposase-like protein
LTTPFVKINGKLCYLWRAVHPRGLQTETLGCAGRMAHSHRLILTWNSVVSLQMDGNDAVGLDFV